MNILLLEDDTLQLTRLKQILTTNYPKINIDSFEDYDSAIKAINSKHYDVFILDIKLTNNILEYTGITLATFIRSNSQYRMTPIIFITSLYDKIDSCVNDIHCYSYIKKPYNNDDIVKAINNILINSTPQKESIKVKIINSVSTIIYLSDITYISSLGRNIEIHLMSKPDPIITGSYTLTSIISELPDNFTRCHNKYIVNTSYVTFYDLSSYVININKIVIPIGGRYIELFDKIKRGKIND